MRVNYHGKEGHCMNLLIKGAGFREGYVMIAGPGDGILKMLEFGRVGVVQGRPYTGHTGTARGGFRHHRRRLPARSGRR